MEETIMSTLILPCAGQSSRHEGLPKWLKPHPSGGTMVEAAARNFLPVHRVYVICRHEHMHLRPAKFPFEIGAIGVTVSQVETVRRAIECLSIQGEIIIKDCDNSFSPAFKARGNFVCCAVDDNPGNSRSYARINEYGLVADIAEKKPISNTFCAGAYGFNDAEKFMDYSEGKSYISEVIKAMLPSTSFVVIPALEYEDYGTQEAWDAYLSTI